MPGGLNGNYRQRTHYMQCLHPFFVDADPDSQCDQEPIYLDVAPGRALRLITPCARCAKPTTNVDLCGVCDRLLAYGLIEWGKRPPPTNERAQ